MEMKIIVTGGCGFIGHHLIEHLCRDNEHKHDIVVIDKLSYASVGLNRLRSAGVIDSVRVFTYDLIHPISKGIMQEIGTDVDIIVHMAAETHVDNSISDPVPFIRNNVDSTVNMLEWARKLPSLQKFFYFSTDEVFGPAHGCTSYKEWDRHCPTNPYSASKSAAENICLSYENTYKVPVIIMNVMNAFGERQHPEKFIPMTIKNVLMGNVVCIHSYKGLQQPGSRFYIHARNIAAAVMFLIKEGIVGEKYNVAGEMEVDNLELAKMIAKAVGKELKYEMVDFHSSRPGHDLRYGLDGSKMTKMGWHLPVDFYNSLQKVVKWTLANQEWLHVESFSVD